jgi:imidazolonepropionase-like amidohydrolase
VGQWRALVLGAIAVVAALPQAAFAQVAVRAKVLHTMAPRGDGSLAPVIDNGVVVITDGKVAAVGQASEVAIPAGHRVLEAAVVTPGLIDARCTVGVSGILNQKQDQDQLERSAPIQPELRAIDAYNPLDPLVAYVRSYGVTTIHTGHAPGELISGQTAIFKTAGDTVEAALVRDGAMIAATVGPSASKGDKSPGNRAKMIAMLREQLIKAREYDERVSKGIDRRTPDPDKPDEPAPSASARDLRLESLVRVLKGELPLLVTAHRSQDIANVLRLAKEFGIRVVLDGASEAYLLVDELKAANVDVIIHPTQARAVDELENKSFETAGDLQRASIRVAMQGGYEPYVPKARVVLFEAGTAAGVGRMGMVNALRTITIDAAKILGVDARVGSLEVGKDGDVALYDADPFEYTSHCVGVVINGAVVSEAVR